MPAYKDKKRGTYYVRFRYKDYTGNLHQTTKRGFKTKKEAQEYERKALDAAGTSSDISFDALCDCYLKDCQLRMKTSGYISVGFYVNGHIRPAFAKRKAKDITAADIREWENDLLKATKKNGQPYASTTLHMITARLSSIFNYAIRYYGFTKNPVRIVGTLGRVTSRKSFWTLDEFQHFIRQFGPHKDRQYKLAYILLFYSGMRSGELGALTAEDFDFVHNEIRINKSFSYTTLKTTTTKTPSSVRRISMPPVIMQIVKEYLQDYRIEPSERAFVMTQHNLLDKLKKYAERAHLPVIHVHDLRHSHASYLIHAGVPITTISARLGHVSPNMTLKVYSHMYKNDEKDVVKTLEKALAESFCAQSVLTLHTSPAES